MKLKILKEFNKNQINNVIDWVIMLGLTKRSITISFMFGGFDHDINSHLKKFSTSCLSGLIG